MWARDEKRKKNRLSRNLIEAKAKTKQNKGSIKWAYGPLSYHPETTTTTSQQVLGLHTLPYITLLHSLLPSPLPCSISSSCLKLYTSRCTTIRLMTYSSLSSVGSSSWPKVRTHPLMFFEAIAKQLLMDQLWTAVLALAAAMPQSSSVPTNDTLFPPPGLTCTETSPTSPLVDDCILAYLQIEPGNPEFCILVFLTQDDFKTVGTCTVHTYSESGRAHCLNRDNIRSGILDILGPCSNNGSIQGSYTWTAEDQPREGVKLIRSAAWVLEEWEGLSIVDIPAQLWTMWLSWIARAIGRWPYKLTGRDI